MSITASFGPPALRPTIGLVFSGGAPLSWVLGAHPVSFVLISGLVGRDIKSVLRHVPDVVFYRLMRWGLIPTGVRECGDPAGSAPRLTRELRR
jgi:hypothetical protein